MEDMKKINDGTMQDDLFTAAPAQPAQEQEAAPLPLSSVTEETEQPLSVALTPVAKPEENDGAGTGEPVSLQSVLTNEKKFETDDDIPPALPKPVPVQLKAGGLSKTPVVIPQTAVADDADWSPETRQEVPVRRPIVMMKNHAPAKAKPEVSAEELNARNHHEQPRVKLEQSLDNATLGQFLRAARNAAGLSPEAVCAQTRIRLDYLIALEEDDAKHLPPPVYVSAYIRMLCDKYRLDKESYQTAEEKLKQITPPADVPEKLIQEVEQNQSVNLEEQKRMKKLLYAAVSLLALLIILISWGVVAIVHYTTKPKLRTIQTGMNTDSTVMQPPAPGAEQFDTTRFDRLTAPQVLEMRTLDIKKSY